MCWRHVLGYQCNNIYKKCYSFLITFFLLLGNLRMSRKQFWFLLITAKIDQKISYEKDRLHWLDRASEWYFYLRIVCKPKQVTTLSTRHYKCLNHHNQRLCNSFFDWRKFGAPNIRCFVITFFVSFLHSFCVKIQANEGEK